MFILFRLRVQGVFLYIIFFFQAEDGIRDTSVTGVQTCALPIWSHTAARKTCLVGGMAVASSIGLSAFVESTWACLSLLTLAYASLSFTGANVWVVASEIAPTPGHVASIGGIQNFAGNLAGIMISAFTGQMLVLTKGSFLIPLVTAGGLCVVGALSYLLLVGKVEPLPPLQG